MQVIAPAFTKIAPFEAGHAAFRLSLEPRLLPLALEMCLHWRVTPLIVLCPQCIRGAQLDGLFARCDRCPYVGRDSQLDLLWGLAFGGLTTVGYQGVALVHEVPFRTRYEPFQRLYRPFVDTLSVKVYNHLQRMFWAMYPLVFLPSTRHVLLPDCTCGHASHAHRGADNRTDFFATPRCIDGCACPYYQATAR